MSRPSMTSWCGRAARLGLVVLSASALSVQRAQADLAYSAYRDGAWRVYVQTDLESKPEVLDTGSSGDAGAPALSPCRPAVALEIPGQDISVCPLEGDAACEAVTAKEGWLVRPAWDSQRCELFFVRYVADASGEDSDLYTARGDAIEPLVVQTGNQDEPDVSPDGRWLVYSSAQTVSLRRAGVRVIRHLWVLDLVSGAVRLLSPGTSQDSQPDWSPDGSRVAFASDRSGQFEIWVIGTSGEDLRQVTSGAGSKTWPAWSPDGKSIMFTLSRNGRQSLWIIGADGTGLRAFQPFGADSDAQLRDADWR